jgi:hypothetical protein
LRRMGVMPGSRRLPVQEPFTNPWYSPNNLLPCNNPVPFP